MFKYLSYLSMAMGLLSRLSIAAADHRIDVGELLFLLRHALAEAGVADQVVMKSGDSEQIVSTVKAVADKVRIVLEDKECTALELLQVISVVVEEMGLSDRTVIKLGR